MKLPSPFHCLVILLFFSSAAYGGDIDRNAEEQARKVYENQTFILRNFYTGDRLKYSPDGMLVSGGKPGTWTLDGFVTIRQLEFKKESIVLTGNRKYWSFDRKTSKSLYFEGPKKIIEIGPLDTPPNASSFDKAIRVIFLQDNEPISDAVPDYWKNFVKETIDSDAKPFDPAWRKLPFRNSEVSAEPVLLKDRKAAYSAIARQAKLEGSVLVKAVVDKEGRARVKDIIRPLGLGLEENVVNAIPGWEFKPAYNVKNEPIDYECLIEVVFNLY